MEDIKKIFSIKKQENYVITKKILGITLKYTRGKTYNELCKILTYLNNETKFHISESLINDFQKKIPLKHISSEIFEKDYQNFKDLLNEIDARELPPSTGKIRELQLNTLKLAKEITKDIENNTDIKLWLDGGSLLGAVRHKGFIPWDDDIDIATNRSDYTKLQAYLSEKYQFINTDDWRYCDYSTKINEILKIYPDQIFCFKYGDSFKCVKGISDLFYIVDFFAWDYINTCHNIFT
ncbi:MAG: LicD family protein, partial [Candidatus Gastranaerophilales bacterium]|nr:LicD family protein [Candidatus Gastranaerophilales bacterium]